MVKMNPETKIKNRKEISGMQMRWRILLNELAPMNRVHSGPEMAKAWRILAGAYPNCELLSWPAGWEEYGWKIPPAWILHRAVLTGPDGKVIADSDRNPLEVYSYSPPFTGKLTRDELEAHLFSNPKQPNRIPFHFRNQYRPWEADWGFCLPHAVREKLPEGEYLVFIDTEYDDTTPMEGVIQAHQGELADSLLFVSHFDHPGQACDGLLGCLAGHEVLTRLAGRKTRLTYRMLSSVEVIGSVFFAAERAEKESIREAMVTATAGARAPLIYARSSGEDAFVDRAMTHILKYACPDCDNVPFRSTLGNDEGAFDVAGVGIHCGSLMRWPFPEYHTDADTPDIVDDDLFEEYVRIVIRLIDIAECNAVLLPRFSGLPCLSNPDINLYISPAKVSGIGTEADPNYDRLMERLPDNAARNEARRYSASINYLMKLLPPLANGSNTTLDIAERCNLPFSIVDAYTDMWVEAGLLDKQWINPFNGHKSA